MKEKIKKLKPPILFLILILIPLNQIALNYLFKYRVFNSVAESTFFLIQPTLLTNLFSLAVFSFLIFIKGKHDLFSVWFPKEKWKKTLLLVFLIWFVSQVITFIWVFVSEGTVRMSGNINILIGSLLGQLFGNAAFEELIYRGILFLQFYLLLKTKNNIKKSLFYSVIISQIIFALIHIPNRLIINQVNNLGTDLMILFTAGSVLTLIFIITRNLLFLIGIHALINQPFNLIETDFPMRIIISILVIISAAFWNKIMLVNDNEIKSIKI